MQKVWGGVLAQELYGLGALLSSKYETNLGRIMDLIFSSLNKVDSVGIYLLDKDVLINLAEKSEKNVHPEDINLNEIDPEHYYLIKAIEDKELIYFYPRSKKENIVYVYNTVPHSFAYKNFKIPLIFKTSIIYVPLVFNNSTIGLLVVKGDDLLLKRLGAKREIKTKLLTSATYFASISRYLASIIDKQLDPLTRVSNRRSFEIVFEDKIEEYKKQKKEFSLLLVDIDHFKKINDNFGHLEGDIVLRKIAKILLKSLRSRPGRGQDSLCRWGGEEFIVLLNNCNTENAKVVGERMRAAIEVANFSVGKVTISVGVAGINELDVKSQDLLISLADERLYKAKESGRNRVVGE